MTIKKQTENCFDIVDDHHCEVSFMFHGEFLTVLTHNLVNKGIIVALEPHEAIVLRDMLNKVYPRC